MIRDEERAGLGGARMARGEKLVAAGVAAALLASSGVAAAPLQALGPGEGAVDIVAWPGYIERGETDKAYQAVDEVGSG